MRYQTPNDTIRPDFRDVGTGGGPIGWTISHQPSAIGQISSTSPLNQHSNVEFNELYNEAAS